MVLPFITLFLLLCTFSGIQHRAQAVEIFGGEAGSDSQGQGQDDGQGQEIIFNEDDTPAASTNLTAEMQAIGARNTLLHDLVHDNPSAELFTIFTCAGNQRVVNECNNVRTVQQYMNTLQLPLTQSENVRRKRLASSWFGSEPTGHFSSFNTFGSGFNNIHSSFPNFGTHSSFTGSSSNAVVCPSPTDQSLVYNLGGDGTLYPAGDIGVEIALPTNIGIRDCLMREMVLPTDPPQLIVEPFRLTANATCAFTQFRLWSYTSQATGQLCWVLSTFQEIIPFRVCTSRFCQNCKDKSFTSGLFNFRQKFCIPEFQRVSLWAFCPSLPLGARLVRDRIIIPVYCSCQSIFCEPVANW